MDWLWLLALVVFVAIQVAGVAIAVHLWRGKAVVPLWSANPRYVFRYVKREDRAAYSRIMRRTMAVATRDLGRAFGRFQRDLGKRVLPVVQRFADALTETFGKQ